MISLICDNFNLNNIISSSYDSLFCNIMSTKSAYNDIVDIWTFNCSTNENIALIMKSFGCVTISFNLQNKIVKNNDLIELEEFLNIIGFSSLSFVSSCPFAFNFLKMINKETVTLGSCLKLIEHKKINPTTNINPQWVSSTKEIYNLLVSANEPFLNVPKNDSIYVDINHKMRHDIIYIKGIYKNDNLISSCMTLHHDSINKIVVIGGVYCVKEHRGNNYPTNCINALIDHFKGYNIYIYCDSSLENFYARFGFSKIYNFYQI